MSDFFSTPGENGNAEYYEEFPIRLVDQFEGIFLVAVIMMHALPLDCFTK